MAAAGLWIAFLLLAFSAVMGAALLLWKSQPKHFRVVDMVAIPLAAWGAWAVWQVL